MKSLFQRCFAIALALLSISSHAADPVAEKKAACPADHRSVGQKPPAGYEWKCVDSDGATDGLWLMWYTNGQLMSERAMKHGKEHGRQRSWWPNGQLMMEGISYEGNRYKGFKYWAINGEPTELQLETETVTKKIDDGKSDPEGKPSRPDQPTSAPSEQPAKAIPSSQKTPSAKP